MKTSDEITSSIKELKKSIGSIRADVGNYIQPKVAAILNEIPSPFGCTRWLLNYEEDNKRICLDLYATGKIVFDFQTALSPSEKTSLDTSKDFTEPNMKERRDNYFDLSIPGNLDRLVQKIKDFVGVPV